MAVTITFSLESGRLQDMKAALHPFAITGTRGHNDFCPQLLGGKPAENVLKKVQQDTAFTLPPYSEGNGAVLPPLTIFNEQ